MQENYESLILLGEAGVGPPKSSPRITLPKMTLPKIIPQNSPRKKTQKTRIKSGTAALRF